MPHYIVVVVVDKTGHDLSEIAVTIYIDWASRNCMPCNLPQCNELALCKKNVLSSNFMSAGGIKQLRESNLDQYIQSQMSSAIVTP